MLRAIVEGVEAEIGESFFVSLVRHLAAALGVRYAFVSELLAGGTRFRTRALWGRGRPLENLEVALAGTPCEAVLGGGAVHHAARIQALFPTDQVLAEWGAESYCGVPLVDPAGSVVGHLAVLDDQPMPDGSRALSILRIFAGRARAELDRIRAEEALRASEARFRDLYEEAPVAYLSVGTDGRIRQCNRHAVQLFGYAREELVGRSVFDLVADTPSGRPRAQTVFERFLSGIETLGEEVEFCRRDGVPLWIRLSVRPIRDAQGAIVATRSMLVDVTELKRAEAALRQSEQRYRDLFEGAPVAYFSFDTEGRLVGWNRRAEELTGYDAAELRGIHFLQLGGDSPAGHARQQELFARFLAGEETVSELEGRRKDGTPFWARAHVRPLRDADGAIVASQSIIVDITDRKRAEEALRASEERFRDLYDEAPVAYIYEDLESRFVRANRAAVRLLGLEPDEVVGTLGKSLLAPTLQTQQRIRDALGAMKTEGTEFSGVELELRRKDDGRPIWVQWYSKPEPDGEHTRTILIDVTDRVLLEREKALVERENEYLQEEIKSVHNFEEIVGQSAAVQAVLEKVALVAGTDSSVLIFGETGTGKELIARAVHSNSPRRDRPLIKVNCAALPTGLIESELFGHEKGAFTGALERRVGRFELAGGGTIFLDEIGELPPEVQVKLLRVLQEREFERVGGSRTVKVDVRIIAATNRDLAKAVADRSFRQDLYYRLNVFPVALPPLRERPEDIPLLVHYFVERYAAKIGRKISRVSRDAMARLAAYPWPGNVRELENVIERAVILSPGPEFQVRPELVPEVEAVATAAPPPADGLRHPSRDVPLADGNDDRVSPALRDVERSHIAAVLKQTGWRIDGPHGAARILNMRPSTLRSRIKKLGIERSRELS